MPSAEKRQRQKEARKARLEAERKERLRQRRNRLIVNLVILGVVVGGIAYFVAQSRTEQDQDDTAAASATPTPTPGDPDCGNQYSEPPQQTLEEGTDYVMVMETSKGTIEIDLAEEESPITVNSVVFLAKEGFYDGLRFHRLVEGFALQGGDPCGDGSGGSGYQVTEAPPEGFVYEEGVVAMAKAGPDPAGTSGSQFFIVPGDQAETLPAQYAFLGRVIGGMDVVKEIEAVPTEDPGTGEKSRPLQDVLILTVTIEER